MHPLSPPPTAPTTSTRGLILRFVGLWLAGLILSVGRFDWAAQPVAAPRGFILSGYVFSLFFLAVALLGWLRDWWRQRAYWIGFCAGTILLNFPRHALRLDRVDYYSRHPVSYGAERNFIPTWLGGGAEWHGTDWWFATLCAGLCLWLVILLVRRNQGRGSGSAKSLLLVAAVAIVIQAWLHHSSRSPYSYIDHHTRHLSDNYSYTTALLPDHRGLVNQDESFFLHLEGIFLGTKAEPYTMLIRRPLLFYLSSHVSPLMGPFHGFILLNMTIWLLAVITFHRLVRALADETVARFAAGFLVFSPGFIMYVAQPTQYLAGFAVIVFMFGAVRLVFEPRHQSSALATTLLLGVLLAACLLVTDMFVWLPSLVIFSAMLGYPWRRVAMAALLAVGIFAAYLWLVFGPLGLQRDPNNDKQMFDALRGTFKLIADQQYGQIYARTARSIGMFVTQSAFAFFIIPLGLAIAGLMGGATTALIRRFSLICLLPAFGTFWILQMGDSWLGKLSRFNFVWYPAAYLLAGLFLARLAESVDRRHAGSGKLVAILLLGTCAVLANCDVFGHLPQLYYHFYYSENGFFAP